MPKDPNKKYRPVKIPASLLPAVREYKLEDDEVGALIEKLTERMKRAEVRLSQILIDEGLLAVGEIYSLDVRYLAELGEAFLWKEDTDHKETLH